MISFIIGSYIYTYNVSLFNYLISWYSISSDGTVTDKLYTFYDAAGGWYLKLEDPLAKRITAGVLALILAASLVYYNFIDKAPEAVEGAEVGQMCPTDEIPLYNSDQTFGFSVTTTNSRVRVINFWGTWCGPCKMMAPIVHQLAEAYAGQMKIGKLNVDQALLVAQKYRVMNIPTFIFFKGGEPIATLVGGMSKADLEAKIKQVLA